MPIATELPMWVREGECQPRQCGSACCRFLLLEVNPVYRQSSDLASWLGLHGVELVERYGRTLARIPLPCSALATDGACTLHGTPAKPAICRAYPQQPADLFGLEPGACSYTFRLAG